MSKILRLKRKCCVLYLCVFSYSIVFGRKTRHDMPCYATSHYTLSLVLQFRKQKFNQIPMITKVEIMNRKQQRGKLVSTANFFSCHSCRPLHHFLFRRLLFFPLCFTSSSTATTFQSHFLWSVFIYSVCINIFMSRKAKF